MCVCVVCALECRCPRRSEEGTGSPAAAVMRGYELVSARNQTQVLCKSSVCFQQLRYLSRLSLSCTLALKALIAIFLLSTVQSYTTASSDKCFLVTHPCFFQPSHSVPCLSLSGPRWQAWLLWSQHHCGYYEHRSSMFLDRHLQSFPQVDPQNPGWPLLNLLKTDRWFPKCLYHFVAHCG